jgi:hypothetical protein
MKQTIVVIISFSLPLIFTLVAHSDDNDARETIIGTWQVQSDVDHPSPPQWSFTRKDAAIEITEIEDGSRVASYLCKTDGTFCQVKAGGEKATISLWFNGPSLVEMEKRGLDVLERRFVVLPQKDTMEMQLVHVVPGGKTEMFRLKRSEVTAHTGN